MRVRWIIVLSSLIALTIAGLHTGMKYRFRYIVIHHSASAVDNYASIRAFHVAKRGWADAAYHLILSNGSTGVPAGYLEPTSRYETLLPSVATPDPRLNLLGLHICIVGNYSDGGLDPRVASSLGSALEKLQRKFCISDDHVIFHRHVSSTECPGTHISDGDIGKWKAHSGTVASDVSAQHSSVLGGAAHHWRRLPRLVQAALADLDRLQGFL